MKLKKLSEIKGFSLVELIISLFCMSLIISVLCHHTLSITKQFSALSTKTNEFLETNAVIESLRYSIRNAGFTPCANLETLSSKHNFKSLAYLKDNQNLEIQRMDANFDTVLDVLDSNKILITKYNNLSLNTKILIADCKHAETNTISHIQNYLDKLQITLEKPLQYNYELPSFIGAFIEESFYIKTSIKHQPWFYYKKQHAERITNKIKAWTIEYIKPIVRIKLLLTNNQLLEVITRNRQL